jgi:cytochrome c oxidase cbb3-type subunit 3
VRLAAIVFLVLLAACEREQRQLQVPPPLASSMKPLGTNNERNAYAMAQGKTLFRWFNCNGCHSAGGGGIGPPLMDGKWRYGSSPDEIYKTIMEGRPSGMPSFRGRIAEDQAWQLVAYVRSMSGFSSKAAAPGRNDSLQTGESENRRDQR